MKQPREHPFSAPFNWCDRRCERCGLQPDCSVARRERQLRWVHEARGEDPDAWEVVLEDMSDELTGALETLMTIAEEEGIDLSAPVPPMPISIEERRLQRAGVDLSVALKRATDGVPASRDDRIERAVREVNAAAITLGSKAARIGTAAGNRDEELWLFDSVPNLLLIERLRARIDELLPLLGADDEAHGAIDRALGELDRILVPLIMAVPREMRALLAALIRRGKAPSPFYIVSEEP